MLIFHCEGGLAILILDCKRRLILLWETFVSECITAEGFFFDPRKKSSLYSHQFLDCGIPQVQFETGTIEDYRWVSARYDLMIDEWEASASDGVDRVLNYRKPFSLIDIHEDFYPKYFSDSGWWGCCCGDRVRQRITSWPPGVKEIINTVYAADCVDLQFLERISSIVFKSPILTSRAANPNKTGSSTWNFRDTAPKLDWERVWTTQPKRRGRGVGLRQTIDRENRIGELHERSYTRKQLSPMSRPLTWSRMRNVITKSPQSPALCVP